MRERVDELIVNALAHSHSRKYRFALAIFLRQFNYMRYLQNDI